MRRSAFYLTSNAYASLYVNNNDANLLLRRLDALYYLIATSMRDHTNLLFYRFDLRLSKDIERIHCESQVISRFMKRLKKVWNSEKRGKLHYIWCKEKEDRKGLHWHVGFIVDSKFTTPHYLGDSVDKSWRYAVGSSYKSGLVERVRYIQNVSKHTGHLQIAEVVYWWSYLCKHRKDAVISRGSFRTSQVDRNLKLSLNLTYDEKMKAVTRNKEYLVSRAMKKKPV